MNKHLKTQTNTTVKDSQTALSFSFHKVRKTTLDLCNHLEPEDFVVQSMPDVSPLKWHLAHTTWFFETFILEALEEDFSPFHPSYHHLFNSYYQTIGSPFARSNRGLLTRPTVNEVRQYRRCIDERIQCLLENLDKMEAQQKITLIQRLELGLNHEQQHQELMLTDIKHIFSSNPLHPAYSKCAQLIEKGGFELNWLEQDGGLVEVGSTGDSFAFDNEKPEHQVFLKPFSIANRLVTNGEYLQFMDEGGYSRSELWLSDGWAKVEKNCWAAPLYWQRRDGVWMNFTLLGLRNLSLEEPVCHVSYYEAEAYAAWKKKRLPREEEWEVAASAHESQGNFLEKGYFHPLAASSAQFFGDVWEWTASPYTAYPGFQPLDGSLGEYNGKFMVNQFVLKGGSCATPESHIRLTYRNFFYPHSRWQFTGIRLADTID